MIEGDDAVHLGAGEVERLGDHRDRRFRHVAESLLQGMKDRQRRALAMPLRRDDLASRARRSMARSSACPVRFLHYENPSAQLSAEALLIRMQQISCRIPCIASARSRISPLITKFYRVIGDFVSRLPATGIDGKRRRCPESGRAASASLTSALISGVIGLRWGTTSPIEWVTSGSTIGIARTLSVRPSDLGELRRHDARPLARCGHGRRARSSSSIRASAPARAPAARSSPSMMRRFCMSGVSRQSGTLPTSAQVTWSRLPSGAVGRGQQPVFLDIERARC